MRNGFMMCRRSSIVNVVKDLGKPVCGYTYAVLEEIIVCAFHNNLRSSSELARLLVVLPTSRYPGTLVYNVSVLSKKFVPPR